jgi:apolipoprotein D and lipocalin family protein
LHRVTIALILLLAACAAPEPPKPVFRSASAPIWSAAAFQPSQIAGRWQQVAGFQAAARGSCSAGGLEFRPAPGGLAVEGVLCLNGVEQAVSGLATPKGPGRLAVEGQEDWWILWVDSGYRTLAIGTPSGSFGFVLDRGAAAGDRLAAAREIFDFNGYVAGALRAF